MEQSPSSAAGYKVPYRLINTLAILGMSSLFLQPHEVRRIESAPAHVENYMSELDGIGQYVADIAHNNFANLSPAKMNRDDPHNDRYGIREPLTPIMSPYHSIPSKTLASGNLSQDIVIYK